MPPSYGASQSSRALPATSSTAAAPDGGPSRLATRQDMTAIRALVQRVARLFYEDKHIIVMDRLVKYQVVPADALAGLLGVAAKDVSAMCSKLIDDRLICVHRRSEAREGFGVRAVTRMYYFLDYASLLNVLKWRLLHMRRTIESGLMADLHTRGFVCPRCRKRFSTLDVMHLLDPTGTTLVCDTPGCGTELRDNEDAEDVRRSKDRMMRFNEQCGGVLDALKHVDDVVLPRLDVTSWISEHGSTWRQAPPSATGEKGSASLLPSSDIAIATGGTQAVPALQVDLTSSDPAVEAAKRARERAEAEEKRRQNQLPEWLQRSTVSGEHTGVGGRQNASEDTGVDEETRKKEEDDYYAQYASLQAAQAASAATTSGEGTPAVQEDDDDDDLDLEDVDVSAAKPTPAAANGKRAREQEQEAEAKRLKSEAAQVANSQAEDDDEADDDMEEVI